MLLLLLLLFTLGSIWSRGWQKLDRLQNTTKLAGMTCHLIKQQSSHEAELHWSVESTRSSAGKESCPLEFHPKFRQSVDQWETRHYYYNYYYYTKFPKVKYWRLSKCKVCRVYAETCQSSGGSGRRSWQENSQRRRAAAKKAGQNAYTKKI